MIKSLALPFLILTTLISYSALSNVQCFEILQSASPSTKAVSGDFSFAQEQLEILRLEERGLRDLSHTVSGHLKLLTANRKLREAKGGFSQILDAQRTAKITKLKSALRDGDIGRVWEVVDETMMRTEFNAVVLNQKQRELVQLQTKIDATLSGESSMGFFEHSNTARRVRKVSEEIESYMVKLHEDYTLYRSFRATFEDQILHGRNRLDRDFAKLAFSKTGLANSSLLLKLPESSGIPEGTRPSIDFIRDEYSGENFADGTKRYLSGQGLFYKLQLENKALKSIRRRAWMQIAGAHKVIDTIAQAVRRNSSNKPALLAARALDWIVKDLQNQEALTGHLSELESIKSVHPSRQVNRFQVVRSNFKNAGVFRSKEFDFLTSFARAQEYRKLWKRVHFTLALRNVDSVHLIDKLIAQERKLAVKNTELDLIQSEINSRGEALAVNKDLLAQEGRLITAKAALEKKIAEITTEISKKVAEFLKLETDLSNKHARPTLQQDLALYKDMVKANERATTMGPLSYEFSPGTGARFTAFSVVVIVAGRQILVETGAVKYLDQLLGVFGLKVPEWEALQRTFEPLITAIGNGTSIL